MQLAAISVSTLAFVFALINFSGLVLMAAYLPVSQDKGRVSLFAASKMLQAVAWILVYLEMVASKAWYWPLASVLGLGGFALDTAIFIAFRLRWHGAIMAIYAFFVVILGLVVIHNPDALTYSLTGFLIFSAAVLFRRPWSPFRFSMASGFLMAPLLLYWLIPQVKENLLRYFLLPDVWSGGLLVVAFLLQMLMIFGYILLSKEQSEEIMRQLSYTDSLTGLANRRGFFTSTQDLMNQGRLGEPVSAVILADLDHFKHINDTRGHDVGDQVLEHFSATLRSSVRGHDLCARFGGEEFLILLPHTGVDDSLGVARRIQHRLWQGSQRTGDHLPHYTASFGLAWGCIRSSEDLARLIKESDEALYHSKAQGRDRITLYAPPVDSETLEALRDLKGIEIMAAPS